MNIDKYFGKINWKVLLQISLICGTCFLAYNKTAGWGWLLFILFITLNE